MALKLASRNTDDDGVREAQHLARREAAVLTQLRDFAPDYLIDSGDQSGGESWPLEPDVTYRGGMIHFTAPETAAHILATPDSQSIAIDKRAEVYALAAVFHLAWTGLPPCAYTHDRAPWRDKLKDVTHGRQHDPKVIRPWPWPAFENALRHALSREPEERIPSMTRFRDILSSLNTSI